MRKWRITLATAGIALALFGVFRLLTQIPFGSVIYLLLWMIAAVVIHDGVFSPLLLAVGAALTRIPVRARRFVQAGLIVAASVTVISLPLIYRRDSQPAVKAILLRNYAGNLGLLVGLIGAVALVAYAIRVARDSARPAGEDRADSDLE